MSKSKNETSTNETFVGLSDNMTRKELAILGQESTKYLKATHASYIDSKENPLSYQKNKYKVPAGRGDLVYRQNPELQGIITKDEAIAVAAYTGESYSTINSIFKDGKIRETADITEKGRDRAAYAMAVTLDSALKKLQSHERFKAPEVTQRYFVEENKNIINNIQPGNSYTPIGFMSTTTNRSNRQLKKDFLHDKNPANTPDKAIKFKISGSSGVAVSLFSYKRGENEVLYRPGTKFEVTERKEVTRRGRKRSNVSMTEQEQSREAQKNASVDTESNESPSILSGFKKTGKKPGGSVPGYMAEDTQTGDKYIIKKVQSDNHARNEVIAAKLYEAMGFEVPELSLYKSRNSMGQKRLYVASKFMDGLESKDLKYSSNENTGLYEGFIADAFLSNWDTVGLEYDNIKFKNGKAVRLDLGGSLEYRAQGTPKGDLFGDQVNETQSLLNTFMNNEYSTVFKNKVTNDTISKGFDRLESLTDEKIGSIIDQYGSPSAEERKELYAKLTKRKDDLFKQKNKLLGIEDKKEISEKTEESSKWREQIVRRRSSSSSQDIPQDIGMFG